MQAKVQGVHLNDEHVTWYTLEQKLDNAKTTS